MKNLSNTKTLENLMKSFAGESQARMRYTYYASIAGKENLKQIEAIFIETADNEKEHAKLFYKHLLNQAGNNIPVTITADYPVAMAKTYDNLRYAQAGEHDETENLYPHFAKIAAEEGFPEIAKTFEMVAKVEKAHENRYRILADKLSEGTTFKNSPTGAWKCKNCGYVHTAADAPDLCPVCSHQQGYFEIFYPNY